MSLDSDIVTVSRLFSFAKQDIEPLQTCESTLQTSSTTFVDADVLMSTFQEARRCVIRAKPRMHPEQLALQKPEQNPELRNRSFVRCVLCAIDPVVSVLPPDRLAKRVDAYISSEAEVLRTDRTHVIKCFRNQRGLSTKQRSTEALGFQVHCGYESFQDDRLSEIAVYNIAQRSGITIVLRRDSGGLNGLNNGLNEVNVDHEVNGLHVPFVALSHVEPRKGILIEWDGEAREYVIRHGPGTLADVGRTVVADLIGDETDATRISSRFTFNQLKRVYACITDLCAPNSHASSGLRKEALALKVSEIVQALSPPIPSD
jgi:hypothetical protein